MTSETTSRRVYSYLGPAGTFTEAALDQVPEARGQVWNPVSNVGAALDDVASKRSDAAMIAIENSIEGGVSSAQDALATIPGLRIVGEYLVPVAFSLVAPRGVALGQLAAQGVVPVAGHPVAYAQCLQWLGAHLPRHEHVVAASNVASAIGMLDGSLPAQLAIVAPNVARHYDVDVVAEDIGDNRNAVTRFVLVTGVAAPAPPTGADKTSLVAELPRDAPGALLEMLEQFSTRGINLSLLESRPIGDELGRYRFVIDADGHVGDERMADALMGLKRYCPRVVFLGSYPRADRQIVQFPERYGDDAFVDSRDWLRALIAGEPEA